MWLCLGWGRKVVALKNFVLRFEINEISNGKECKGFGRSSIQVWIRAKSNKDLDGTQLLHLFLRKYFTFLSKGISTTHANLDYFRMLDICCSLVGHILVYHGIRSSEIEVLNSSFFCCPFTQAPLWWGRPRKIKINSIFINLSPIVLQFCSPSIWKIENFKMYICFNNFHYNSLSFVSMTSHTREFEFPLYFFFLSLVFFKIQIEY